MTQSEKKRLLNDKWPKPKHFTKDEFSKRLKKATSVGIFDFKDPYESNLR